MVGLAISPAACRVGSIQFFDRKSGGSPIRPVQFPPAEKQRSFSALLINLGALAFFKYSDFFIENLNLITGLHINSPGLAFPLAISFFTFVQIAYLVDRYRGEVKQEGFVRLRPFCDLFSPVAFRAHCPP